MEATAPYWRSACLCRLAKGIGKGLAKHFKETLLISETQCMHKGASSCEIHFRNVR
jgi:predicted hydrocarbon binding protein